MRKEIGEMSPEEIAARLRARRRRRARSMAVLASLMAVAVTAGVITILCDWAKWRLTERSVIATEGSAAAGQEEDGTRRIGMDEDGNLVDEDGKVIGVLSGRTVYSQEDLEMHVAAAREQAAAQVLAGIKEALGDGATVLRTLRPLYPEDMIVYSGGQYHFVPIDRSLRQHQLKASSLNVLESGEYQYMQDGKVISRKGIDVSSYQGTIDWALVAQDGVEFAFVRAGYRGYVTGKMVEDDFLDANISGALAAGIKVGVYFYSQAVSEEEAREEADFMLERIAPYRIDCPVVLDVEKVSSADGRMNKISVEERTKVAIAFCEAVEKAGYRPMIYHNTEAGAVMLDQKPLDAYDKWFAAYEDTSFYYPYAYKVWQYSQSGTVQGIKGAVDLNLSFGPLWEE